jgi:hypothetical protein
MKRYAIAALLSLPFAAFADPKPAPSKMSPLDAAKLDAAFMHREIVMSKALSEVAPFEREIQRICKAYGIDAAQLGKSVGVDPQTGDIQRAPKTENK